MSLGCLDISRFTDSHTSNIDMNMDELQKLLSFLHGSAVRYGAANLFFAIFTLERIPEGFSAVPIMPDLGERTSIRTVAAYLMPLPPTVSSVGP